MAGGQQFGDGKAGKRAAELVAGEDGAAEGVRFGLLLGVFVASVFAGVNYATLNIGLGHSLTMATAAVVEWTLLGTVIGVVYKPAAAPARQGAGV